MVQDEVEVSKAGKNQVMQNLVDHCKDFEFYPKCNEHSMMGQPLKGFKQRRLHRQAMWFV